MAKDNTPAKPDQRSEDPSRLVEAPNNAAPADEVSNLKEQRAEQDKRDAERAKRQASLRKELESAEERHGQARAAAEEARAKVDQANKPRELLEAEEADRRADDEAAKAADVRRQLWGAVAEEDTTVVEAKVLAAPLVGAMKPAGDHMAQKFGNDPENPKLAPGVDPNDKSVRLQRITPDSPTPVYTSVAEKMVGDYLRAGWSLAEPS